MSDIDDYRDPRYPQASRPPPTTADPPPGPPDPRSPIRQLIDTYELEEEQSPAAQTALLNTAAASAAAAGAAAGPEAAAAAAAAGSSVGAGPSADGADVHISAARIPFANWHITASVLPAEFDTPLRMRLLDVIAKSVPDPPPPPELDLDDDSILGEMEKLIWEAAAKVQHAVDVEKAVQERVDKIKAARALMPMVPQGQGAGMLQSVQYTTVIKGQYVTGTGWMYVEPEDSEYGEDRPSKRRSASPPLPHVT